MWKYGYLLHENKEDKPLLIELKTCFSFHTFHLFRKMGGAGQMTLYETHVDGHREVIHQMALMNNMWFGHDQLFLKPGHKLMMAFHGVKKKENAFMAESVNMIVHGHDSELKETRRVHRIIRSDHTKAVDVFRHKFRRKVVQDDARD